MILETFEVGPFLVNCYLVGCEETRDAMIIDPGDQGEYILKRAQDLKLNIKHIVNTHGHGDHIKDNGLVKERTGAPLWIHELDSSMLTVPNNNLSAFFGFAITSPPADHYLEEGKDFVLGNLSFKIIHTPGHSQGGVSMLRDELVFVGDTLFRDSIGRTDLPGGDFGVLEKSIKERLYTLGDDVVVYPGHGQSTTIGYEKLNNYFVRL